MIARFTNTLGRDSVCTFWQEEEKRGWKASGFWPRRIDRSRSRKQGGWDGYEERGGINIRERRRKRVPITRSTTILRVKLRTEKKHALLYDKNEKDTREEKGKRVRSINGSLGDCVRHHHHATAQHASEAPWEQTLKRARKQKEVGSQREVKEGSGKRKEQRGRYT